MPICQAFERRNHIKRSVFSRKTEKFSLSREIREREKERWGLFYAADIGPQIIRPVIYFIIKAL